MAIDLFNPGAQYATNAPQVQQLPAQFQNDVNLAMLKRAVAQALIQRGLQPRGIGETVQTGAGAPNFFVKTNPLAYASDALSTLAGARGMGGAMGDLANAQQGYQGWYQKQLQDATGGGQPQGGPAPMTSASLEAMANRILQGPGAADPRLVAQAETWLKMASNQAENQRTQANENLRKVYGETAGIATAPSLQGATQAAAGAPPEQAMQAALQAIQAPGGGASTTAGAPAPMGGPPSVQPGTGVAGQFDVHTGQFKQTAERPLPTQNTIQDVEARNEHARQNFAETQRQIDEKRDGALTMQQDVLPRLQLLSRLQQAGTFSGSAAHVQQELQAINAATGNKVDPRLPNTELFRQLYASVLGDTLNEFKANTRVSTEFRTAVEASTSVLSRPETAGAVIDKMTADAQKHIQNYNSWVDSRIGIQRSQDPRGITNPNGWAGLKINPGQASGAGNILLPSQRLTNPLEQGGTNVTIPQHKMRPPITFPNPDLGQTGGAASNIPLTRIP